MKCLVLLFLLCCVVNARPVSIIRGTVELKADVTEFPSGLVYLADPYVIKDKVNHAISTYGVNTNWPGHLGYVQRLCNLYGVPYGVSYSVRRVKGQVVPVMNVDEKGGVSFQTANEFNMLTEINCNKKVPARR